MLPRDSKRGAQDEEEKVRTLVITSSPSDWHELAAITNKAMKAWCDLHDYDFFAWTADVKDYYFDFSSQSRKLLPVKGFVKLDLFLRWLPEYDRVLWLDADQIITDYSWTVERIESLNMDFRGHPQVFVGFEHNGHNTTTILAYNTPLVYDYMWACNNTGRKLFLAHDWVEMEAMRYFAQTPPYTYLLGYFPVTNICPILPEEYVDAGLPLRVSEKYGWKEGAFSVHLSALSLPRRIELAKQFAERFPCPALR